MKNLPFSFVCLFAVGIAPLAKAELLIYKGVEKEIVTGENNGLVLNWKAFLIVDHDTGNFARVRYASHNGTKRHFTLLHTNSHIVQVIGPKAHLYTAITRIPTDCDAQEFPGSEGVYFKGSNVTLTINTNTTAAFPRILTDAGIGLSYSSTTGEPILDEGGFVFVFNQTQTLASNEAGETLDIAFARIIAYVQSLGY